MRPTRLAVLVLCRPPRWEGDAWDGQCSTSSAAESLPEASPP